MNLYMGQRWPVWRSLISQWAQADTAGARALTEVGKSKRRSKLNLISLLIVLRKTWNRTMALIDQEPSTETSAGFPCVTFTVVMLKERWLRLQFLSQEAFNNVFLNNQRVNVEQSQTNKAHPACPSSSNPGRSFSSGPGWRRHCSEAHLHGQKEGFNQSPGVDYTLLQVWDPPLTGASYYVDRKPSLKWSLAMWLTWALLSWLCWETSSSVIECPQASVIDFTLHSDSVKKTFRIKTITFTSRSYFYCESVLCQVGK